MNTTPESEFLFYQTENGETKLEVRLTDETVWLTQLQMSELFQRDKSVISRHINNIFAEGELQAEATVANFATVQKEGSREINRNVEHYSLDVIISVGYRVKSHRGTQFRQWATGRLREYLIKGFAMDDERLKRAGQGNYFDELLARIRDIRSSEKEFWRKVLDIYATSIDYSPNVEVSRQFFATVQNKMHWAAHGRTAAEVIVQRADADKPNMGMTNWLGEKPRKTDAIVAKNYLSAKELDTLNRIVNFYLEFAEMQALNRKPLYMAAWVEKLDSFLALSDHEILTHAGNTSSEQAVCKAQLEYDKYQRKVASQPTQVEEHFNAVVKQLDGKQDG